MQEENKIVQLHEYTQAQETAPLDEALALDENGTEEEDAEVLLKAKYTLTPEQIAEYGEELAKKKQEQLDFLLSLRHEVTVAREEREQILKNGSEKERFALLKKERREAKARQAWGKQLAKQQQEALAMDLAKALQEEIKKGIADGSIKVPEQKREGGKPRRNKKGS